MQHSVDKHLIIIIYYIELFSDNDAALYSFSNSESTTAYNKTLLLSYTKSSSRELKEDNSCW